MRTLDQHHTWVDNNSMGIHTGPTPYLVDNSSMGIHTGPNITLGWDRLKYVNNSAMGIHTESTPHWVDGLGSKITKPGNII